MRSYLQTGVRWAMAGLLLSVLTLGCWTSVAWLLATATGDGDLDAQALLLLPWPGEFKRQDPPALAATASLCAALVGAALGLLLRWQDANGQIAAALHWSLRSWMRGWPLVLGFLIAAATFFTAPANEQLRSAAYISGTALLVLLQLNCMHPGVICSAQSHAWWVPRKLPASRVSGFLLIVVTGIVLDIALMALLPRALGLVVSELLTWACTLAATLLVLSTLRHERPGEVIAAVVSPTVLPRWLLAQLLLSVAGMLVIVQVAWFGFLAINLRPLLQHSGTESAPLSAFAFWVLNQFAGHGFATLLIAALAFLPLVHLFEARLLASLMGWTESAASESAASPVH